MQAVILAGGKGTRLADRLKGRPKPLVDVCSVPLLRRQIEALKLSGVDQVIILVNHAAEQIAQFCHDHNNFGVHLSLIDDGNAGLGTAGALLHAFDHLDDRFIVIYGDTLFDVDLGTLVRTHESSYADVTLMVHPNDHPSDSDIVQVDDLNRVIGFHPYPHPPGVWLPNLVNAALYVIEKRALFPFRRFRAPSDLARDLFPAMLDEGASLRGYRSFEYIKDLGTPARLQKVENDLMSGRVARARASAPQKCVFIDRDGTLNELAGFIRSSDELRLLEGAAEAVRRLNEAEFRTAVVTNQPVIARGECSMEELQQIHWKLETQLGAEGAFVDGIWSCPHHPDRGYPGERREFKISCDCRKPETGLIRAAAEALNADLSSSWLVGDSTADILAANRAGLGSILVRTGEGGRDGKHPASPDHVVPDIGKAVDLILKTTAQRATRQPTTAAHTSRAKQ
jgi:histidinol-phosphate phosphatase family protein